MTIAVLSAALGVQSQAIQATEDSALVNVLFTDFKDQPQQGEKVIFIGKSRFSGVTNDEGKFSILLPEGDTYEVKYINITEEVDYSQLEIKKEKGNFTYNLHLQYEPAKTYTLKNVYFETGKATIKKESYEELDQLAELLTFKPTMEIEIAGHTDDVGSPEDNLKLSQARAKAVKSFLVKKGIEASRIKAVGYGETQPIASNASEEGRQKNRRTEVHILKE